MKKNPWLPWLLAAGYLAGQKSHAQQPDPSQTKPPVTTAGKPDPDLLAQYNAMRILVAKGQAPIRSVLALEFGGRWPLKPAEMSHYAGDHLDSTVYLKWAEMKDVGNTNTLTGVISLNQNLGSSNIDYNTLLPSSQNYRHLVPTAAHEAFHAAEGQGSYMLSKTAIFLPDNLVPSSNNELERYFGRGMNKVLSMGETPEQRDLRLKKIEEGRKNHRDDASIYSFKDAEILTRMHTLMAFAYKDNGDIPKNKAEMWRVMDLAGFELPQEQFDYLKNTKEGHAAEKKFKSIAHLNSVIPLNQMRNRINNLSPEQKKVFYEEVVPADAGIVLNVLGHKNGFKAMGINIPDMESARKFLHEVSESHENSPTSMFTPAQWEKAAKGIDPSYAGQAFLILQHNYSSGAMRALIKERSDAISHFLDDCYGPGKGKETIKYYQDHLDSQHAANASRSTHQITPISARNSPPPPEGTAPDRSNQKVA